MQTTSFTLVLNKSNNKNVKTNKASCDVYEVENKNLPVVNN